MTAKNNDYPQTLMQELHNWRKERDLRLAAEHTLKCTLEECQNLKERLQQINDAYHAAEADVTIANARIKKLEETLQIKQHALDLAYKVEAEHTARIRELDSRIGHIIDDTLESNNEDHIEAERAVQGQKLHDA
jgi:hypothetical protein